MDVSGAAFTGAPPEEWPEICAAALIRSLAECDRIDVAFPIGQAARIDTCFTEMAAAAVRLAGGGDVRITRTFHRPGWERIVFEIIADGRGAGKELSHGRVAP